MQKKRSTMRIKEMQEAESIKRAAQKRIAPTTKRALNEEKYSIKE